MSKDNLKPVPEIGKYYHFWDDGKVSPGRHYICKVENLIKVKEAKNIIVKVPIDEYFQNKTLYEVWKESVKDRDLFTKNTDYFVEISCPEYDKNNLYAVRTKNGGWFTLDIQNWWQGGILDVTGEIFEEITNYWELNEGYIHEGYFPANEEHYNKRF